MLWELTSFIYMMIAKQIINQIIYVFIFKVPCQKKTRNFFYLIDDALQSYNGLCFLSFFLASNNQHLTTKLNLKASFNRKRRIYIWTA